MEMQIITKIEDSKYFYSKTYPIKYYEMDCNQVLKPSALLNLLQDMATINAEMLGFGYSFTHPKNYGWFLIKYHMEFDNYPHDLDDLVVKTEARGIAKIFASRDFEICTTKGKRLGRVASNWMMIDLDTKSILPLARIVDFMPAVEKRANDLSFERIKAPEKIDFEKVFEIRYDDIDVNQHVNNANYIVWAFEILPHEFRMKYRLKTLDIIYKKEIAFGEKIISSAEFDNETNTSTHVLKNATTNEDLCLVCAEWV